jgi:hypothetical protein
MQHVWRTSGSTPIVIGVKGKTVATAGRVDPGEISARAHKVNRNKRHRRR